MRSTAIAAVRIVLAAASVSVFTTAIGAGAAHAAPEDCTVTRDLFGATATCHDYNEPAGREYSLIVECYGLHNQPFAFPLPAFGHYQGSWSGSFSPSGHGSASCLSPITIGTSTNAYVKIYRY